MKNEKITVALLVAICLVSAIAIGIPNTIAKNDSSKEPKFRKSDNPLLYLPVDEEKWVPIVPPEPVERPLDEVIEESVEVLVYDVKTKNTITKSLTKPVKTTSKITGNQGSLSSELNSGIPIGYGDRVRITPTTGYPFRTICKLFMYFPSSGWFMGSGFIIDDYHVLTAGHCVYDPYWGEFAASIEVIPAMDDGYGPFYHAWAEEMAVTTDWANYGYITDDFAILTLDRNVGVFIGWMGLEYADPSDSIYTGMLNTAGYPGDLDGGWNMYFDSDWGDGADLWIHGYWMDTRPGQSGSPVWYYDNPGHYVLSIVTYETDPENPNLGTRLSDYWFGLIDFIRGYYTPPIDYANLVDDGQDYSGFDPVTVAAGISSFDVWSDIRNIGTSDSGTFSVSYYASIDAEITTSDYLIGVDEVTSITPFTWADSDWYGTFPDIPDGNYYVGWIIDSTDVVPEPLDDGEGNNVAYKDTYQLTVGFAITDLEDVEGNPISSGIKGDTVVVLGSGVTAGEEVKVGWDSLKAWDGEKGILNSTTAKGDGSFLVWFDVPEAVVGDHYIWVKDMDTGETAMWGPFTVLPRIKLTPSSGLFNDEITVKGYGFAAEEDINPIVFDDQYGIPQPLTTTPNTPESDGLGSWEATFKVPHATYGDWTVTATDESSNADSAEFTIGPSITVDPEEGPVGTVVQINGRGFSEGEVFDGSEVTINGIVCYITIADTVSVDGEFMIEVVIPQTDDLDEYDLTVTEDDGGGRDAYDHFDVTGLAEIELNPKYGVQGATVSIEGWNFTQIFGEEVEIWLYEYDGVTPSTQISDNIETELNGEFSGTFTVPAKSSGQYKIKAIMTDYNIEASASFKIGLMIVIISPWEGPTGTEVILTGTGFTELGGWNATFGEVVIFSDETVDADGDIYGLFYVPTVDPGIYTITVLDVETEIEVNVEFTVISTNTDPSVDWIRAWGYPGGRLDPGGVIETGGRVIMYSQVGDAETLASELTVSISYRPQGGGWTTEVATYNVVKDYWRIDWIIPMYAAPGLYDVKVDVEDPHGGTSSTTEIGEFTVIFTNTDPSVNWIRVWGYPGGRLDPGGEIETGGRVIMYSQVGDAETPASDLTVSISYRPQGGSWTTEAATYNVVKDYWRIDWIIPMYAAPGLYDVKVDVEDPHGGSGTQTETGEFTVI